MDKISVLSFLEESFHYYYYHYYFVSDAICQVQDYAALHMLAIWGQFHHVIKSRLPRGEVLSLEYLHPLQHSACS